MFVRALRRGLPIVGGAVAAAHAADVLGLLPGSTAQCDGAPKTKPGGSFWTASWTASTQPKGKKTDPAIIAPPLALQEEFDVVIVRARRPASSSASSATTSGPVAGVPAVLP
jgi:hypothetical protein